MSVGLRKKKSKFPSKKKNRTGSCQPNLLFEILTHLTPLTTSDPDDDDDNPRRRYLNSDFDSFQFLFLLPSPKCPSVEAAHRAVAVVSVVVALVAVAAVSQDHDVMFNVDAICNLQT